MKALLDFDDLGDAVVRHLEYKGIPDPEREEAHIMLIIDAEGNTIVFECSCNRRRLNVR